jgi:hypothetical protein
MRAWIRSIGRWLVLAGAVLALSTSATNYSLWINGRTGGGQLGNYADFTYWGPAGVHAGVNKKSVNWDGYSHVADQSPGCAMRSTASAPAATGATSPCTARAT